MKRSFDIVIAGAGMVGLTLAALLGRNERIDRLNLTVIDAGNAPLFNRDSDVSLRVSAISAGSVSILRSAGAWDTIIAARACPFREMRVWDAVASIEGPDTLHFDAAEHALPELGFIVENALIQHALTQALDGSAVSLRFATRIAALQKRPDCVAIELDDGQELAADLVVGADGVGSFVRRQAGMPVNKWSYAQTAFVTHVQPQEPHRHVACQRFLKTGPIGLLPLADGRVSLVWSTTAEQAESALKCTDDALQAMLTEASDGVLGELRPAGPRGAFPLNAQFANNYVAAGFALIGDAAHSIHPLAGQGANLGIADASILADVIIDALGSGEHPGDLPVLRRYERARKGANQAMLRLVDGLSRLFATNAAPVAGLRAAGMRMFNRSGPVKRRAVQVALGINP